MSQSTAAAPTSRPARPVRTVEVAGSQWLTPELVRVWFTGEGVEALPELEHTDHYVKFLFPPAGAPYSHPVDPEAVQAAHPRELWPVTRTYTCLLYTSPSPRDRTRSRMPSSA